MSEELIEISDEYWTAIKRVLRLMVEPELVNQCPIGEWTPYNMGWFKTEEIKDNGVTTEKCVCFICGQDIVVIGSLESRLQERTILRNHGFNHLKERNLVPFL